MMYLNIRHRLPQTDIRHEWGKYDAAAPVPAQVHTNSRQARSNQGATQSRIESIDSYSSRRTYGARSMPDFNQERQQKGLSGAREGTSRRTQEAWEKIENGAKKGNDVPQHYKGEMMSKYSARTVFQFEIPPTPSVSIRPGDVVGEPDVGDVTAEIQPANGANVSYSKGSVETYVKDQGFIRRWVSEGKYDIYA